jgi:ketosteroid isomerase-like protein
MVDTARKLNAAIRRGDWDAMAPCYDPHVSLRTDPSWPEQRIYGREAVLDFLRSVEELWGPDIRIEEIVDLGDRLLVRLSWNTHGRTSGIEGVVRFSEIATYRDGRIILSELFLDHDQALEVLGLEE